jgi:hypothetical protein
MAEEQSVHLVFAHCLKTGMEGADAVAAVGSGTEPSEDPVEGQALDRHILGWKMLVVVAEQGIDRWIDAALAQAW